MISASKSHALLRDASKQLCDVKTRDYSVVKHEVGSFGMELE